MALASITVTGRGRTDRLLDSVVARLIDDGVRVAGALRAMGRADGTGHCDSDLRLLPEGPVVRITQDLGAGSAACRLDAGALEEAVGLAGARLAADEPDLLVLNKFGLSEAEGRGFRTLIAEALGRGVPVLIGVPEAHRAAFDRFAEGMAIALPPEEDAIVDWCRGAVRSGADELEELGMPDPAAETPTPALIAHIRARFHDTHRRELPELIALARKVESVHADDINAPHGLTHALETMVAELEEHMHREEAVVFPALNAGRSGQVAEPLAGLRDDHSVQEAALNRIAAIAHGFRLPVNACGSWRRLYAGLGKLAEDLDEHRYLEDDVLFPRFEAGG